MGGVIGAVELGLVILLRAKILQGRHGEFRKRNLSPRLLRFRLLESYPIVRLLDSLVDHELLRSEVDIPPAHTKNFTAAQAGCDAEKDAWVESRRECCFEQPGGLRFIER